MSRTFLIAGVGLLLVGLTAPLMAQEDEESRGDSCGKCMMIKAGRSEFCETHGKGMAFDVQLTSKDLFDALQGVKLDREATMKCPGCKKASETNGKCDHCNMYFVLPRGYKSAVAYKLAKGNEVVSDAALQCDSCKKAWDKDGVCTGCNHYFAAHRMFKSEEDQKAALTAFATLEHAASAKCPTCAVAMVTDGTCDHCKVTFKDGEKVKS